MLLHIKNNFFVFFRLKLSLKKLRNPNSNSKQAKNSCKFLSILIFILKKKKNIFFVLRINTIMLILIFMQGKTVI
jgi:hypothetical protein